MLLCVCERERRRKKNTTTTNNNNKKKTFRDSKKEGEVKKHEWKSEKAVEAELETWEAMHVARGYRGGNYFVLIKGEDKIKDLGIKQRKVIIITQ